MTLHAVDALEKRQIQKKWMEHVLGKPEWTEIDPIDVDLEHRLGRIVDFDNRVLRVIVNIKVSPAAGCDSIFRPKENSTMKLKVDHEADALYLSLGETPASESEEVAPGIIVDYDEKGQAVGIEMLHLSKRAPGADIQRVLIESVPVMR